MASVLDGLWGEALEEAYASAPTDEVVLHTLELRHPSFTDAEGNPSAVRLVRDPGTLLETIDDVEVYGLRLRLEDDAPMNAGEFVTFVSCMFDFSLPGQAEGSLPEVEVSLDNVTREVSGYLDTAVGERATLELTYREFLASDKGTPQFILSGLSLSRVRSTVFRVSGSASFVDLLNSSFPKKLYRPSEFRGLMQ